MGPSGEVLLDYAVYDAKQAGISRVVFLIRKDLEADFRKVIGKRYEGKVDVAYAFQELHDLPKGFSVPEGRKSRGELGRPFLRQVRSFGGRLWPLMQMIFTAGNRTNFFSNIFPRKRGEAQGIRDGGISIGSDFVRSWDGHTGCLSAGQGWIPRGRRGIFRIKEK